MFQHFEQNTKGRDFIIGDIHGCFNDLNEKLSEVSFDCEIDRIFSVGDLIDRGKQSDQCIYWLTEQWFHAVRGNHEQLAIDYFNNPALEKLYRCNGGQWFIELSREEQETYIAVFETLPIAIDIETPTGLIGIVHAECPVNDWLQVEDILRNTGNPLFTSIKQACLWDRNKINNENTDIIHNVSKVYVGHTPASINYSLGNSYYIDTGIVFGGELTIVEL
jgi:serine/threonine protein phosphatase 1